jgi:hypothetical protein
MDEVAEFLGGEVEEPVGITSVLEMLSWSEQVVRCGIGETTYWSRSTPR